jgi:carboxymethylenebutenolidase
MSEISISTPHHQLKGYVAAPPGKGPWPGVIVLHDIFGMSDVTRGHADWLAKEGFLAVAPDLFSWGGRIRCIRSLMADLTAQKGPSFDDVDAIRQWLVDRQDCTGKTGVIGFCAGGGFAILLAVGHGFSAVAPNYGHIPDDIDAFLNGACPMVASFGGSDWMVPKGTAARLEDALEQRKIEHDVKEYPGVGHAFLDDFKGPMWVLCVVLRATYKDKEAADARNRIRAFFARHLT